MSDTLERKMFATRRHGQTEFHIIVSGPRGAIQFHFVTVDDRKYDFYGTFPLRSMGVETHKRVPVEESNNASCYMLDGAPCYHDGTSLWASEYVMPLFMGGGSDAVYPALERCYHERFGTANESDSSHSGTPEAK